MSAAPRRSNDWSTRWLTLARAARIGAEERLLVAVSGGADSVLLLHWLAAAEPALDVRAVHVDHGLRAEESTADARFVTNLCSALGVPLTVLAATLDPHGSGLEARARAERYRLIVAEARRSDHLTVLTGHHADDALETLLQRWLRGTDLAGLRGPRAELHWHGSPSEAPVRILRPLLTLRREEVRTLLQARGLSWREDRSNADPRFTRSRVRHDFMPLLDELGGPGMTDDLRAFGRAVEEFEGEFARATAHLVWHPPPHARASRGVHELHLGGMLARGQLMALARPLARRVLWRLLTEGTGAAPARGLLERLLTDLVQGRSTRHSLSGGWTLLLRPRELFLLPPRSRPERAGAPARQLSLPFPNVGPAALVRPSFELAVPGMVTLDDGRRISAELTSVAPDAPVRRLELEVELDARDLPGHLSVRWPAPGDRFRVLGAPGSKPLLRFLADRGLPREERPHVPVVFAGEEILWVAGFGPSEGRRVRAGMAQRLRLALHA